jgi:hypothetical protein
MKIMTISFALSLVAVAASPAVAGPIVSDFPGLPTEGPYCGIYADLVLNGYPAPEADCETITPADMLLHVQTVAGASLAAELVDDPTGRGYAGHTFQEQADMLGVEYPIACADNAGAFTGFSVSTTSTVRRGQTTWYTMLDFGADAFTGAAGSCYLKFDAATTTEALQGLTFVSGAKLVTSATSVRLNGLAAAGADPADAFHLWSNTPGGARIFTIINGLVGAPNLMSAADVQAALGQ